MNKLIEQLAEQAAEEVVDHDHDVVLRVEHESGAELEVPADFIFKFAELIVRECAEICLEANDHKNILRHFGVDQNGS